MATLTFSGTTIALVVRGKKSASDDPPWMAQHADCILADGMPLGFYGVQSPIDKGSAKAGMGLPGAVWDYPLLKIHRPFYVDLALAKRYNVISTVLVLDVSVTEAKLFKESWDSMKRAPGEFNFVGGNCSTHASLAFVHAGIVSDEIPGLDTPNNLYIQLAAARAGKTKSYSGFVGATPTSGGGFTATVDPP
jgi:hypothetical protein